MPFLLRPFAGLRLLYLGVGFDIWCRPICYSEDGYRAPSVELEDLTATSDILNMTIHEGRADDYRHG